METILENLQKELAELAKVEQDRNQNPDWWIHAKEKYTLADRYSCQVVSLHKYERSKLMWYSLVFTHKAGKYPGSTRPREHLPEGTPVGEITAALDKHGIEHTTMDRNAAAKVTIDFMLNSAIASIGWVNGIGQLCMGACRHMLVVEDESEQEVTIKYVSAATIKAIYEKTVQPQRPHILESLARVGREDADAAQQAQAEKEGVPIVFCLLQEKGKAPDQLLMMNAVREQFESDLFQYILHDLREDEDFCELWTDSETHYDSFEPTLRQIINEAFDEALADGESGWIMDLIGLSPREDIRLACKRLPVDPEKDSEKICSAISPRQGVAEKAGDKPRRWYLELLASTVYDIEVTGSYDELFSRVCDHYKAENGSWPGWKK